MARNIKAFLRKRLRFFNLRHMLRPTAGVWGDSASVSMAAGAAAPGSAGGGSAGGVGFCPQAPRTSARTAAPAAASSELARGRWPGEVSRAGFVMLVLPGSQNHEGCSGPVIYQPRGTEKAADAGGGDPPPVGKDQMREA